MVCNRARFDNMLFTGNTAFVSHTYELLRHMSTYPLLTVASGCAIVFVLCRFIVFARFTKFALRYVQCVVLSLISA